MALVLFTDTIYICMPGTCGACFIHKEVGEKPYFENNHRAIFAYKIYLDVECLTCNTSFTKQMRYACCSKLQSQSEAR